jgi:hypothetical protein
MHASLHTWMSVEETVIACISFSFDTDVLMNWSLNYQSMEVLRSSISTTSTLQQ